MAVFFDKLKTNGIYVCIISDLIPVILMAFIRLNINRIYDSIFFSQGACILLQNRFWLWYKRRG